MFLTHYGWSFQCRPFLCLCHNVNQNYAHEYLEFFQVSSTYSEVNCQNKFYESKLEILPSGVAKKLKGTFQTSTLSPIVIIHLRMVASKGKEVRDKRLTKKF